MAKKDLLDSIDVPEPCSQSWDAMNGDDKSRFCGSCGKDIHNLSAMTRGEIKKLLFQSKERPCIRLEKDETGKIKTLKKQLHQITRRVPLAAGVLSASLTFAVVADAQKKTPRLPIGKVKINDVLDAQTIASLSGTITDIQGAVIPNAKVSLLDTENKLIQETVSNTEGFYEFKNIKAGIYNLETEAQFFKKFVLYKLKLKAGEKKDLPVKLDVENDSSTVGILAFAEPVETIETKVSDKVQTRQIESLPVSNRRMIFLGLFASGQVKAIDRKNAQNLSRISFTIYGPQNEIAANETVELTNQKTGRKFTALSNNSGIAGFDSIPQGRYNLVVSGNGFNEYKGTVQIREKVEPNVEIHLQVGTFVGVVVVDWSEIPLFRAVAQDDNGIVKNLIDSGFAVNTKDENGETALHVAVQSTAIWKSCVFCSTKEQKSI